MSNLKRYIKEHKKGSILILCLLLIFISSSTISAINVQHKRAETTKNQEVTQQPVEQKSETEKENTDHPLTKEQKQIQKNYDKEAQEFIALLKNSTWSANNGKNNLHFTETTYTEANSGKTTTHTYVIEHIEKSTDDSGAEKNNLVILTDTGTHILKYTKATGTSAQGNNQIAMLITSQTMFTTPDIIYQRIEAIDQIKLTNLEKEATIFLGGDKELTQAISQYSTTAYPTATEAQWNKTITMDYETKTITTQFTLNTQTPTTITLTYHTETKQYEIKN